MLQVAIFDTLQRNQASIDFSVLLIGVLTIADEIDSQYRQGWTVTWQSPSKILCMPE
jgi:hypothetical protein